MVVSLVFLVPQYLLKTSTPECPLFKTFEQSLLGVGAEKVINTDGRAGYSVDNETTSLSPIHKNATKKMETISLDCYPGVVFTRATSEGGDATGRRPDTVCALSDVGIHSMLKQLFVLHGSKPGLKIEVRGDRYEFGDFSVGIGQPKLNQALCGHIIDITFKPTTRYSEGYRAISEFVSRIFKFHPFEQASVSLHHVKRYLDEKFTPELHFEQYLDIFDSLRQASQSQQSHAGQQQPE